MQLPRATRLVVRIAGKRMLDGRQKSVAQPFNRLRSQGTGTCKHQTI